MKPKFTVGQQVKAIALPNGFPSPCPEQTGLVVTDIRLMVGLSIPSYYRYTAHKADGIGYIEGAERFFEAEA